MIERPSIIDIGYIIGGNEGHLLVEILLAMFAAWAERQGFVHDILDKAVAFGGGLKSAKIGIYCVDTAWFPALHQGVHTLIRIPSDSFQQSRQMSSAGVRVSDFADLPLPVNMADWGDERRRYVCDPDRAIIDTLLGRLAIDPDVVFAGDFSVIEDK